MRYYVENYKGGARLACVGEGTKCTSEDLVFLHRVADLLNGENNETNHPRSQESASTSDAKDRAVGMQC